MNRAFLVVALLGLAGGEGQNLRVPLEVTPGRVQDMFLGIAIETDPGGRLQARLPGGGDAVIERMAGPAPGVIVRIAGADPPALALLPNQSARVTVKRTVGHLDRATYLIGYNRGNATVRRTRVCHGARSIAQKGG